MNFFSIIKKNDWLTIVVIIVGITLAILLDVILIKVICGIAALIGIFSLTTILISREKIEKEVYSKNSIFDRNKINPSKQYSNEDEQYDLNEVNDGNDYSENDYQKSEFPVNNYPIDEDFRITKMPNKIVITEIKPRRKRAKIFASTKRNQSIDEIVNSNQQVNLIGSKNLLLKNFLTIISENDNANSSENSPRKEFISNLNLVLEIIYRAIPSNSVMFFWINNSLSNIIPEVCVGRDKFNFKTGVSINYSRDVISKIAQNIAPEIITELSEASETEMIRYYNKRTDIKSFIGLPILLHGEVIGILACDSKEYSCYDERTLISLTDYLRLIGNLILGYTNSYDSELPIKAFNSFDNIQKSLIGSSASPDSVSEALVTSITDLIPSDYIAVVLFDELKFIWKISAYYQSNSQIRIKNLLPDINSSLIGRSTKYAQEIYIECLTNEVRFCKSEQLDNQGSFLAIPLFGSMMSYGALVIESLLVSAFIPRDISIIRSIARYSAMAIEVSHSSRAITTSVIYDETTGFYNRKHLLNELTNEIERSNNFSNDLSFLLVTVDTNSTFDSLTMEEFEEYVFKVIGNLIAENILSFEFIGRYNETTFGVVLIGKKDQDAYLWSEKIRKQIVGNLITFKEKKISITVSIGINDFQKGITTDSIISGASQALNKASTSGGNTVVLY